MSRITQLFSKVLGMDTAVMFTVLGRIIQGFGGIISVLFIAKFLDVGQQGYFYTFNSILALQVFFELGFTTIITQFTSKHFANLSLNGAVMEGDENDVSYVASLLRFSVNWFLVASVAVFALLSILGYFFFEHNNKSSIEVAWELPWVLTTFSTALLLIITPVLSFLEGVGQIAYTSKLRFVQYSSQIVLFFGALIFGGGLYARPISVILSVAITALFLLFSPSFQIIRNVWGRLGISRISYRRDIFPFQWKISISWLSGYLIYQLFNPVVFAYEGAEAAGKIGMTLTVTNGILTVAMSWINTKIPIWTSMIANSEFLKLDQLFKKTNIQATAICALGLIAFMAILFAMDRLDVEYLYRFLDMRYVFLLCLATVSNLLISSFAVYLRCHLKEPLLYMSLAVGAITALSTFGLGKIYGVSGVVIGYTVTIIFISLPWTYLIYRKCRKSWH